MEILTRMELRKRYAEIKQRILAGAVFIHPTDTIYGLGCNATISASVHKIRLLKQRPEQPFSVWAPSKEWLQENCVVNEQMKEWLDKLPGPYTLVLPLLAPLRGEAVAADVHPGLRTIGVRLPDHWFSAVVQSMGIPLVTTSVNKSGEPFMIALENLDKEIEKGVDFIIYEGEKQGAPSVIINEHGQVKNR